MMRNVVFLAVACFAMMALSDNKQVGAQGTPGGNPINTICCPTFPRVLNADTLHTCRGLAGPPPKSQVGFAGPTNHSCEVECAFRMEGYITKGADGKEVVNLDELNDYLKNLGKDAWAPIMAAAQNECTKVLPKVKPDATCTSGSGEVEHCLISYLFLHCPGLKSEEPACKSIMNMMSSGPR